MFPVMLPAEPRDLQWLGIIIVMAIRSSITANRAGLAFEEATSQTAAEGNMRPASKRILVPPLRLTLPLGLRRGGRRVHQRASA
jgi:hypothetical protein